MLCASTAVLADDVPRLEITPYVGYRGGGQWQDADGDAPFAKDASYGVIVNYRATYKTQWEVFYGRMSTNIETRNATLDGSFLGIDMRYLHAGGTYVFREERLAPFLSMTFGVSRLTPDDGALSEETYFSASMGLGLRYELQRNLGLRLEARAMGLFGKSNSLVFCETVVGGEDCFVGGDRGVIPQLEVLAGLSFRF
ncbi:MAG: outer membrane beta-barrel protein [Pseudomonadota bacterium]